MTITVLDRRTGLPIRCLHARCGSMTRPTRARRPAAVPVNDPELWFAESPADVEFAKALCLDCPVRDLVPRRSPRAA